MMFIVLIKGGVRYSDPMYFWSKPASSSFIHGTVSTSADIYLLNVCKNCEALPVPVKNKTRLLIYLIG